MTGKIKANKLHIGIFGKRNAGKSSLMNLLLGQDFSIVSDVLGTTTDVNEKSMELLPIGSVVLMDTAGIDDNNELGILRVQKTIKASSRADIAIFVFDNTFITNKEIELINHLNSKNIPILGVINKTDIGEIDEKSLNFIKENSKEYIKTSIKEDKNTKEKIIKGLISILPKEIVNPTDVMGGLVKEKDVVILVIAIDKEAPKDRLIFPQVQVIRNLLDKNATVVICKVDELKQTLSNLKLNPKLVITDSQAFKEVDEILTDEISLTSFSILFANLKGDLKSFIMGADKLDDLKNGDKILICESCSHHPIEDDIGRVKIPNLIKKYTKKELIFSHYSGHDFPKEIDEYSLIVHCGACMTTRREVLNRIAVATSKNVSISNYGIIIAKCLGILERAVKIFN